MLKQFSSVSNHKGLRDRLHDLVSKTQDLEASVKHFKSEVHLVLGKDSPTEPGGKGAGNLQDVRKELRGLRYMLRKDAMGHEQEVDQVAETLKSAAPAKVLDHFAQKQSELNDILSNANWLFYMFLLLIFIGGAIGSALWRKIISYEKRHFL